MEQSFILELAAGFGPAGLIIGWLVWERMTIGKERLAYDRERLEADRQLAASLAALTTVIHERLGR
jgi:hypothetical protein